MSPGLIFSLKMSLSCSAQPAPPVLPPLRDDGGATPAPTEPEPEVPTKPEAAPAPPPAAAPARPQPAPPVPTPPPKTDADDDMSTTADVGPGAPIEPPQPSTIVTPPPPPTPPAEGMPAEASGGADSPPNASAPAENPRLRMPDDPAASQVPAEGPELPLPAPPPRPRYQGIGFFAASGLTFGAALGQHVGAHLIFARECVRPIDEAGGVDQVDDATANACYQGALPGVALQVLGDLALASSVGLSAAGAGTRARRDAYDDRFADRPPKETLPLEIAGASMLGAGALMFIGVTAGTWGSISTCEDATCVNRLRIVNLSLRDLSGAIGAAGAGMLTYGVLYRRRYFEYGAVYRRGPAGPAATISAVPTFGVGGGGFMLSGSF